MALEPFDVLQQAVLDARLHLQNETVAVSLLGCLPESKQVKRTAKRDIHGPGE